MQFVSAERLKKLLEDKETLLELLSTEVTKITKSKNSAGKRKDLAAGDSKLIVELTSLVQQYQCEEIRADLLVLASARFNLDLFNNEETADLTLITDGLRKFYKRSVSDQLAKRLQNDVDSDPIPLQHHLKMLSLVASTEDSWNIYKKELGKHLRRHFDELINCSDQTKSLLERLMSEDFQLLLGNTFELDLGPSEAIKLLYLDPLKEIFQRKMAVDSGVKELKRQQIDQLLNCMKFLAYIEEISEKLHRQINFKDETTHTTGVLIPSVDTTKVSSTSKLPLLTVTTSLVAMKQNQSIEAEKNFDAISIVSDMSVEPLHIVDKTNFYQKPLWEWRILFAPVGDLIMTQIKIEVVTTLEAFELQLNCNTVATEMLSSVAVIKGTNTIVTLMQTTDTVCKCFGMVRTKPLLSAFELWLTRLEHFFSLISEDFWPISTRYAIISTAYQLYRLTVKLKGFSERQLQFESLFKLTVEDLTNIHLNRLHFYVLNDSGTSNLYSDHKSFSENESLSFSIRTWSFYLKNVWSDLLPTYADSVAKQKIFSALLLQSLTYFLNRFSSTNVTTARTEQLRCDMRFMLGSSEEFVYFCSMGFADVLGLSSEKTRFNTDDREILRQNIRNIHKTSRDILCCFAIKTCPFDVLYRLFKRGYEATMEKISQSAETVNCWLRVTNPSLYPAEFSSFFDLEPNTAVAVQLRLFLHQPEPNWALLLQLLYVKNYSFTTALLSMVGSSKTESDQSVMEAILWVFTQSGITSTALGRILEPMIERSVQGDQGLKTILSTGETWIRCLKSLFVRELTEHLKTQLRSFIKRHQVLLGFHGRTTKADPQPKCELLKKLDEESIDLQRDLLTAVLESLETFVAQRLPSSWFHINVNSAKDSSGSMVFQLLVTEIQRILDSMTTLTPAFDKCLRNLFPLSSLGKEVVKLLKQSKNALFAAELTAVAESLYKTANTQLTEEVSNIELDKVGDLVAQEIFNQEAEQLQLSKGKANLDLINSYVRSNCTSALRQLGYSCAAGCEGDSSHDYSLQPNVSKWLDRIGSCKVTMVSLRKSDLDWYALLNTNLGLSEPDLISLLKCRPEFSPDELQTGDHTEDTRRHADTLRKRFNLTT